MQRHTITEWSIIMKKYEQKKGFVCPPTMLGMDNGHLAMGKLARVHCEVSEAVEAIRKGDEANFAEELADIVMVTLAVAGAMGIDIEAIMHEKFKGNSARPFLHGKQVRL